MIDDATFGRLELDAESQQYVGRVDFRPGEAVKVAFALTKQGHGDLLKLLRFARQQLAHMRRGEAGHRGYRRRAAREMLRRRPGPKGTAVENRFAQTLQLDQLIFDDDGRSCLVYSSSRSSDLRAIVGIDRQGKITIIDARTHSEIAAWNAAWERSMAAYRAECPERILDKVFGVLEWQAPEDRYAGRFDFHPGETIDICYYLWGNSDESVRSLLRRARTQLTILRRYEPDYRQKVSEALCGSTAKKKRGTPAAGVEPIRLEALIFDEDGMIALHYSTDGAKRRVTVLVDEQGNLEAIEGS